MVFWSIALLMLVAAIMCILWPLARAGANNSNNNEALDIYRTQLLELDSREPASQEDAETLALERTEISRRILKAGGGDKLATPSRSLRKTGRIAASLVALLGVPLLSIGIYSAIGSPNASDAPFSNQQASKLEGKSLQQMVLIAERHLAKKPDDVKGWNVLANVYGKMNRPVDRARALEHVIRISGPSPQLHSNLGEALTIANDNIISQRARKLFEAAWKEDNTELKAAAYLALALEQEGRKAEALQRWQLLSQKRKDDKVWQSMVLQRIAMLDGKDATDKLADPSKEDIENVAKLDGDAQAAMIRSMVDGLAAKLEENPDNFEGWKRLIRSYVVLKKPQHAVSALAKAKEYYKAQPEQIAALDEMARQLHISTSTSTGQGTGN